MRESFAPAMLAFYDASARVLPWRSEPAPYRVWVSEVMLQQTRVEAVLPYFARFLDALPDIPALAAVEEDRLLKLWEGLGYYSRARNLQKAAKIVMERHGGALPADFNALRALPGFGDYTAGAVASIAFGIPVPAVDGNVLRVLARYTADVGDILDPRVKRELTALAASLQSKERPGDFNQAMMELGATVCLPSGLPRCERCPLRETCAARAQGIQAVLPIRSPRKARRVEERTVFVLLAGGKTALRRRESGGVLAGMWEFPGAEGFLSEPEAVSQARAWGLAGCAVERLPDAKHIFTHIEWRMRGYIAYAAEIPAGGGFHWADAARLGEEIAIPSAFRAFLDAALRELGNGRIE